MSTYYLAYSSFFSKYNLSKQGFKLACLLAKSANREEKYTSYKSKQTMANECGCSVSTITRALRELEQRRLLKTTNVYGSHNKKVKTKVKRQTSNTYKLTVNPYTENETTIQCAACSVDELRPNELKVYAFISLRIGKRDCWGLSREEIATACRISKSLVSVIVKALKEKGFIEYETSKENGSKGRNIYSVIVEKLASAKTEYESFKSAIAFAKSTINSKALTIYLNAYTVLLNTANAIEIHNMKLLIEFLKLYSCKSRKLVYHTPWFYTHKLGISMSYLYLIIASTTFTHNDRGVVTPCHPLNYRETKAIRYTLREKKSKEDFQQKMLC